MMRIDSTSKIPPYRQIHVRLAEQIQSGELVEGQRLPSIRQLASDLRVAPKTVARAYKELGDAGLIVSEPRLGSRVSGSKAANAEAAAAATTLVAVARQSGLKMEETLQIVAALWEE